MHALAVYNSRILANVWIRVITTAANTENISTTAGVLNPDKFLWERKGEAHPCG